VSTDEQEVRSYIRDLCKTPPFAQLLRQAQILSLEILNVFLWLKFSPSLALNKIEHFSKVSIRRLCNNPDPLPHRMPFWQSVAPEDSFAPESQPS
jgi:hypothetical protein